MNCSWQVVASRTTPEHLCGKPGDPFCVEHQQLLDDLVRLQEDFYEILATYQAVCDEAEEAE